MHLTSQEASAAAQAQLEKEKEKAEAKQQAAEVREPKQIALPMQSYSQLALNISEQRKWTTYCLYGLAFRKRDWQIPGKVVGLQLAVQVG